MGDPVDTLKPTPGRPPRSRAFYLARLMEEPHPTRRRLADEAGVTPAFVSHVLNGRKRPSPRLISAAERLIGLPTAVLFTELSDE
jgi:transcriptional regulator with XRE-family HTH domain